MYEYVKQSMCIAKTFKTLCSTNFSTYLKLVCKLHMYTLEINSYSLKII